jgi:uncharacterized protein (TIGR01777 family)
MSKILIAGGSGLVGSLINRLAKAKGFETLILTRSPSAENEIKWNIKNKEIDELAFSAQHIINLTGSGIADGRWTQERKEEIIKSRTESTRFLISEFAARGVTVDHFVSASAIGYYGDGRDQWLYEDTPVVTKEFLSEVCVLWEEASSLAERIAKNISVLRIGTVLSRNGGALAKMDMTIPYGVANYFGTGEQYMSWIHEEDLANMFLFMIEQNLTGIYNAVAPEVLTNKAFTKDLRDAVNAKALLLPAPAFGLKIALGEMSRVILNSSRVSAEKIIEHKFNFLYPTAKSALKDLYA